MSLPADAVLLPNAVHFKEFYGGYTGTCGETALTAALICAERLPDNHDQAVQMMLAITAQMKALGWASANGASTLYDLAREASQKRGGSIALEWDYAEPFPHDWHAEFLSNAAKKPIVVELANAQALPGDERGVHYHFVTVVGRCSAGYVVMDGDNWQIEQDFVVYSYADFAAAVPCAVLVLNEKVEQPPVITIDKDSSGNIIGAHDGTNRVGAGFAVAIEKNNWLGGSIAVPETYLPNAVSVAVLRGGARQVLAYSKTVGVTTCGDENIVNAVQQLVVDGQKGGLSSDAKTALLTAHQLLQPFAAADSDIEKALNG
jgi:hypothetical protein